ncbi:MULTISPECIES: plastocyanin/azurin family copper-binding protein [unclassified Haladaptatus]|uniref:plastocyanin/azurin family copper-binding protein n=1 Tax=unclassified Haladaptatus TaxID=2622732 RepID=UPI0023E79BE3|nr:MULTISPECIES: plastocyanin/azurin family copper-binding protein [unclassified Haladaptatus]
MSSDKSDKAVSRRGFLQAAAGSAAVAGAAGNASAQEEGGSGNNSSSGGGGGGGGGSKEVAVGPGGDLVFSPGTEEPLYASPGTTVKFVWESDNHNIVVDSQPGSSWEGHESLENEGFETEFTFEELGTYAYHCQPHKASGMVGEIVINESGAAPAGGGAVSPIPDSAKAIGIATTIGLSTVLGFVYFFMKYGGNYEIDE